MESQRVEFLGCECKGQGQWTESVHGLIVLSRSYRITDPTWPMNVCQEGASLHQRLSKLKSKLLQEKITTSHLRYRPQNNVTARSPNHHHLKQSTRIEVRVEGRCNASFASTIKQSELPHALRVHAREVVPPSRFLSFIGVGRARGWRRSRLCDLG